MVTNLEKLNCVRREHPPSSSSDIVEALKEAIAVFEGMCDDEIEVELLPRLRAALRSPDVAATARNAIIEECAKVADTARESAKEHHGVEASIGADIAARRIRAMASSGPAQRPMDPATIEACAKIAESNGWEATAAQIRALETGERLL